MKKKFIFLASWGTGVILWTILLIPSRTGKPGPVYAETISAAAAAAAPAADTATAPGMRPDTVSAARSPGPDTIPACINVNSAGEEQLCELPGIGPVLARRIMQLREETGRFARPDDLLKVKGVGEKTMAAIRVRICI